MARDLKLQFLAVAALSALVVQPSRAEPQHVTVVNDSTFKIDAFWQALGCVDVKKGITLVCHDEELDQNTSALYKFGDLTSFRQVRVAIDGTTTITQFDLAKLTEQGILSAVNIVSTPEDGAFELFDVIPDVINYFADLSNYSDFFPTRENRQAFINYDQDHALALLQRADRAALAARNPPPTASVPEPGVWLMMVAGFGLVGAKLQRKSRAGLAR